MSTSSLPPTNGDDAPIDAEFEPADPKSGKASKSGSGPGWAAFGLVALVALASLVLASASAGFIPGFAPGSGDVKTLQTSVSNLEASRAGQQQEAETLASNLTKLTQRTDSLQADRTRAVADIRAVRTEIETLQADVSALQRARVASLAETPGNSAADAPPLPAELGALDTRIAALEDALVTQLGTYETSLEALKLRLTALEEKAETGALNAATSSSNRTEAALALSAIEAAARRGRPFISAYQKLETAMPGNAAIERLSPIASKAVPTLSDLRATFPALRDQALDREAATTPGSSNWMRAIFGDGIQVRQKDAVTARDHLNRAFAALEAGELSETIEHVGAIDSDLQSVFTDWLQSAEDRHMLEETLEALRLTMIAEESQ